MRAKVLCHCVVALLSAPESRLSSPPFQVKNHAGLTERLTPLPRHDSKHSVTKLPLVGSVADAAYDLWAVNRLRITGRPELEEILKERQAKIKSTEYSDDCSDECEIKW